MNSQKCSKIIPMPLSVGSKIKRARLLRGKSQIELGEAIGYSDKSVSAWERASDPNPIPEEALELVRRELGVMAIKWFQDGMDNNPPFEDANSSTPAFALSLDGYTIHGTFTLHIERTQK